MRIGREHAAEVGRHRLPAAIVVLYEDALFVAAVDVAGYEMQLLIARGADDGRPLLVELDGIDRLFEENGRPEVLGFWTVDAVGKGGDIAGVRDLALHSTPAGEELHLVTGNVDSRDKQSVLVQDYAGGRQTVATHFRCPMPEGVHSGRLGGEFVREFPTLPRVEGLAIADNGRAYYVTDEDEGVHLRLTRLLIG